MKLTKRSIYIILVIVLTIAADQISKVMVKQNVTLRTEVNPGERIPIIGDAFILMHVENTGAFLGMGSELNDTLRVLLLLILPIVVLGFVLRHIFLDKSLDNWSLFAFASIIGGGIANVYDRIVYGRVTDFLYIDLGGVFRTGIFNLADLSVTTGMIILVIMTFKKKKTTA
ncbi:signal peptidase II [Algibacter amylolyticus]|uniref:Lipoprotein signal peptidase n=1 Tax=Algibacter amylolyticus TaxID=1608400 RepID=A0A5M7BDJ4_9FLAO|nr:signal peptidase II [Algibacter amylolyticus]KAA5826398.1 signal peptidase II [Algibacter amylolyticus]MBB5268604.1 signal peptidase II [Algibacter amylolyticus]TSJ80436.1 signal peptidase II [Algibacter amylolyticus]